MRRFATGFVLSAFALISGCNDSVLPTAPVKPAMVLSDGSNGGSAGFYFLPPLVPQPAYAGTFDSGVSPVVEICATPACAALHASFSMTTGSGAQVVRLEAQAEHYVVNWNAEQSGAVAGSTYRIRVLVGGVVAGFVDVMFAGKGKNSKNVATNESVVMVNGNTLPIKFRIETGRGGGSDLPTQPVTCRSCLEIVPGAFMLTGSGQQKQLRAFVVDAQGIRAPVVAAFTSAKPAMIAVTSTGLATAVAAAGSSQIIATYNSMTSAPVVGLVATPVAGALLISDEQIDGSIIPVDPSAPYKPGWQYRVRLKGVTPAVDQVVINTGFMPIEGKVVSVTPAAGFTDVILALLPISGMFSNIVVNEQIPLSPSALGISQSVLQSFDLVEKKDGRIRLTQHAGKLTPTNIQRVAASTRRAAQAAALEFDLGPFECEAEGSAGINFPISLETATIELNPNLTLDFQVDFLSLKRAVLTGTLEPRMEFEPALTAAVEGKLECKAQIAQIVPPIGGPLAAIVGIQVPYGLGFGIEAKGEVGGMSFDAFMQGSVTSSFGVDCTGTCTLVSSMSSNANGFFKPSIPSVDSLRTELAVSAFGWADLQVGNPLLSSLQFSLLEVKAALQQKVELAGMFAQASDPAYGSGFGLGIVLEAANSADLSAAAGLLSISLPELKLEEEIPLAESPKGTFTITPGYVDPGDENALGEKTTFTVVLDPATYAGQYAVESVEIRWLKQDSTGNTVLEPGRPGCTDIAVSVSGQSSFTCETDFLESHEGVQTFYAFVHAKIFGVPVPIALEIGEDAKATVDVQKSGHLHRRADTPATGAFADLDLLTTDTVSASGGSYSGAFTHRSQSTSLLSGCLFTTVFEGSAPGFSLTPLGGGNWSVGASVTGTRYITNGCSGNTTEAPYSQNFFLAGKSLIDNGVLTYIDFRLTSNSNGIVVVQTGRLKVR